jgi:dihydroorotate dehydrogenase
MALLYPLIDRALQALDAETAHRLAIRALASGWVGGMGPVHEPRLTTRVLGLDFPSPVGLAAGFDKNAEVPDALHRVGFGFVEIGTVTPLPQAGNPRPRLFRLPEDRGVINRMGFPGDGLEAVRARLHRRVRRGILGINVGANKDSADRAADYARCAAALAPYADYLVCNVSSPNTPGLRDLQGREALVHLLQGVRVALGTNVVPVLVKVAPDLTEADITDIVDAVLETRIDGIIIGNTTLSRPEGLRSTRAGQAGGLSGEPLFNLSTHMLRRFATQLRARNAILPLIGCGGIASGADAYAKIRAGASLVQLYSAMVYEGPGLARRIGRELAELLAREGFARVADAVGADLR